MMQLYHKISFKTSKLITRSYSNSFSLSVSTLNQEMQDAIYSIYGFVRLADEIVDTFHNYNKQELLDKFEKDYYDAIRQGISLNPILNSFQITVKKYQIPDDFIQSFLKSMRSDLIKNDYLNKKELEDYVYGSADVVGLMCLKVFVNGDYNLFNKIKKPAMKLGSAFQKVNFLRDLKNDMESLGRQYFPGVDFKALTESSKNAIVDDIEKDFKSAYEGIKLLPPQSGIGVYVAYIYYKKLLKKIKNTPAEEILTKRIRISAVLKFLLLVRCLIIHKVFLAIFLVNKSFIFHPFGNRVKNIELQKEIHQIS